MPDTLTKPLPGDPVATAPACRPADAGEANRAWLREALWRNDPLYALALEIVEAELSYATERTEEQCA